MSVLTAPQKAAIAAGAPFRQMFTIKVPASSGSSSYTSNVIHNDVGGPYAVTNPGQRHVEAYNVSFKEPGRLAASQYTIEVQNSSGEFSPYASGHVWNPVWGGGGDYDADPRECLLLHQVYVLVAGAWSEITGIAYTGRVVDIEFDDRNKTAEIITEGITADILRKMWLESHSDTQDTGFNVVFT